MNSLTQPRKENKPVHGSCRWTHLCHDISAGRIGVLEINGTPYTVDPVLDDEDRLVGHRLSKADGSMYDIDRATGRCDCPDACFQIGRAHV